MSQITEIKMLGNPFRYIVIEDVGWMKKGDKCIIFKARVSKFDKEDDYFCNIPLKTNINNRHEMTLIPVTDKGIHYAKETYKYMGKFTKKKKFNGIIEKTVLRGDKIIIK